ncbi:MAG: M28 family metallopeptidase, partial [Acidobacteria bacterium]|nr:M28 family metallopeptidase [Acidobacteriota bacterium]
MNRWNGSAYLLFSMVLVISACSLVGGRSQEVRDAAASIQGADLAEHVRNLSDDEMEGRGPGSHGEEMAIAYIADHFRKAGLLPAGDDGTFFQEVPLVGITASSNMTLTLRRGDASLPLKYGEDFIAVTRRVERRVGAVGDLLFVGYGTQAPEYNWNDYKGVDVQGMVLVMLVNDPPLEDETLFKGRAMTYYGRWTYKYEQARKMGADGVILIHEDEAAGYPWGTVENSWSGEQFHLRPSGKAKRELRMESWVTYDAAARIFEMAGLDLEEQKKAAVSRSFRPVPLGLRAHTTITNSFRNVDSKNVLGLLEGSDPVLKDEYVIYMAHWDHLGKNPALEGEDKIFNGAYDNATGTAGLFELADAFAGLPTSPKRSVLFLAVTAEEQGLLGSKHYAENPIFPLADTVAVINMDGLNVWGRTKDMVVVGLGNSDLDDDLRAITAEQDREIVPDSEPEKGFFYRSDQFSFAKKGVPSLYADPGINFIGRPEGWGMEQREKYTAENYHEPSDEYDPSWDLTGAAEDLQALFFLGFDVAQRDRVPVWSDGNEFKMIRDRSRPIAA